MKKMPRKLTLSKETLGRLDEAGLSKVDGGYAPSAVRTCPTDLLDTCASLA